jgi:hypothetical protein
MMGLRHRRPWKPGSDASAEDGEFDPDIHASSQQAAVGIRRLRKMPRRP